MTSPDGPDRTLEYLIDSVSDHAIYMIDLEGRVSSWNSGAVRLKGYAPEAIIGQPYASFFTLEDRRARKPERILERAATEGKAENEGWRLRKDGSRFWAQGTVHAVRDDTGTLIGYAKITRDMSGQREAHQALVESEQRFRLLVEGVVDYAIYLLDVNGVVTNWNRGAERIKGYTASEIVGSHFSTFYTPEDRATGLPARALETATREGKFEAEGWRLRKDGTQFWASVVIDPIQDDHGQPLGFAKITRDVSQRREAEQALAESERQFRLLVSGVVDYALYMLDPNGIVTSWNAGAEHIKGYKAAQIVGHHFSRFYTDADRASGMPMRALQTVAATGRYEAEGWRVRKDGSLFWASVVMDAVHDETGALIGFAKITRDITDKREAQQELQRAHERLAQAQKMEALGNLTGGVAHDFNNLLMVVSGQAQLLRKRLDNDPRAERALDAIDASAKRGETLTRHLLAFSRRQRLQPEPVSLQEAITPLRELLGASLPATVQLELSFPKGLWPVIADPGELDLTLLNLAVNARDAMPDGGRLSFSGENVTLKGREDGLAGAFVAITVRDTGVGIPPDIVPKIFDPFFTTKDVNKGTGLGLSQVYGFSQQSGGGVTVTSELGRGAQFTLYLPRADSEPQSVVAEIASEAPRPARILLVEDNPDVAEVACGLLEQLGHQVTLAGNAAAALQALKGAYRPELVFSDIVMAGGMDGLALARQLRDEAPEIPVLLATGYSQAAERIGAEFPILRKPYKLGELSHAIGALLARPPTPDPKLVQLDQARQARAHK